MLWWAYTNAIGIVGVGTTLKSSKGKRVVASILGEICPQGACKFRASRIEYQSIFDEKQTNQCTDDTYSRCNACAKSPYGGVIYMAISEPVGDINFCCKISCFRRAFLSICLLVLEGMISLRMHFPPNLSGTFLRPT